MASSPQLDGITRVLDLIAAPLALEVLDGLGRGRPLSEIAPPGTAPGVLEAALEYLRGTGAIAIISGPLDDEGPVLTPLGRRLYRAFEQASEIDQSDGAADGGPNT